MARKMIWVVLSAWLMVLPVSAAVIGDWSFEEGSGQYAYSAGGGPTLRLGSSGSAWMDPEWSTDGYSGNCLHFLSQVGGPDGAIDVLRPEPSVDVSAFQTTSLTIDARIKLDSIPEAAFDYYNPYTIFSFGGTDGDGANKDCYFLRVTARGDGTGILNGYYYAADGSAKSVIHSARLEVGQWYHVGFSFDSATSTDNISLWVDGDEQTYSSSLVPRTDLTLTGESLCVGSLFVRKRSFDGYIDELTVHNERVAVPEPTSLALLAGAACLARLGRKERNG